jgi:hypothetical protein
MCQQIRENSESATTFVNVFDPEKGKRIAPVYFEVDYPFLEVSCESAIL